MNPVSANEAKCRRCGECCRIKARTPVGPVALDFHCPAFVGYQCLIYKERQRLLLAITGAKCLTLKEAIEERNLPKRCPYVADDKTYDGIEFSKAASDSIPKAQYKACRMWVRENRKKVWRYIRKTSMQQEAGDKL